MKWKDLTRAIGPTAEAPSAAFDQLDRFKLTESGQNNRLMFAINKGSESHYDFAHAPRERAPALPTRTI